MPMFLISEWRKHEKVSNHQKPNSDTNEHIKEHCSSLKRTSFAINKNNKNKKITVKYDK